MDASTVLTRPPLASAGDRPDGNRRLERWTAVHAAVFVIAAAWGFGGNIHWMRTPLACWGTVGLGLTVLGLRLRWRERPRARWPWIWLLPLAFFAGLVLASAANPNYQLTPFFDVRVYRPMPPRFDWLPSSARPELALRELWLLSGLYLAGFNLALNVRRRRVLRGLLLALVINAVVLAVFGTVQKLAGATGLFFGLQPSPNPTFFASFVYHNHWGPFAVLMGAAALALALRWAARLAPGGFWHSPVPALLCGALVLAAAVPLSTSRSSTLLLLALSAMAAFEAVRLIRRLAGPGGRGSRGPLAALSVGLVLGAAGIVWLGGPVIQMRLAKTQEQLAERARVGGLGGREIVYRNTWRMAQDRPWTGWGLESYRTVFVRYNTEGSPQDHLVFHYDQAHSDWLQSLAETGFIGTACALLLGLLPLWTHRAALLHADVITRLLLFGCSLIVLYAWVEFPFANPAVTVTFWVLYFTAIRHAALSES